MQRILKDGAARVVADLAETMLKDSYIHFDDRLSDPMTMRSRATVGVVPVEKVLPVKEQLEQLEAKVTCMCGIIWSGTRRPDTRPCQCTTIRSVASRKRTSGSGPRSRGRIDWMRCFRET
jgi:hypothetical protein